MTDEQINAAITAVYGWEADYCACLNAMHEVEKTMTYDQCVFFRTHLRERLEDHPASLYVWHATARQRAEAFLRVIDKWATAEDSSVVGKEARP